VSAHKHGEDEHEHNGGDHPHIHNGDVDSSAKPVKKSAPKQAKGG
jgi:hypothetical protein